MTDNRARALGQWLADHPHLPTTADPVILVRAVFADYVGGLGHARLCVDQTFKPDARPWLGVEQAELNPACYPAAELAMVFATKYREETQARIAAVIEALRPGGTLVVTAANDLGAASLERQTRAVLGSVQSMSKHKCRVFFGQKQEACLDQAMLQTWRDQGLPRPVAASGLLACPGVFSYRSIDPGSRWLADHLPTTLSGRGADFACGYGYLSQQVLSRSTGLTEWHLFDAERTALDLAAVNLSTVTTAAERHYHWSDLTVPENFIRTHPSYFDCIVMNPPFHTGQKAEPQLGQALIRTAAFSLRPHGWLYLVANRQLPYESTLTQLGLRCECLAEARGYKIIRAQKS